MAVSNMILSENLQFSFNLELSGLTKTHHHQRLSPAVISPTVGSGTHSASAFSVSGQLLLPTLASASQSIHAGCQGI
jgi:hypothetical protein